MTPLPRATHQRVVANLLVLLRARADEQDLGEVLWITLRGLPRATVGRVTTVPAGYS